MFLTLYHAYLAVMASPRLVGVRRAYGDQREEGPSAGPLIHWKPTRDQKRPPLQAMEQEVLDGAQVQLESPFSLAKGVDLHVLVPELGEPTYVTLELLIEQLHLALWDELETDANYEIGDGTTIARGEYVLSIRVIVPVLDRLPTARITAAAAPGLP
jgi:hypothetical protein